MFIVRLLRIIAVIMPRMHVQNVPWVDIGGDPRAIVVIINGLYELGKQANDHNYNERSEEKKHHSSIF